MDAFSVQAEHPPRRRIIGARETGVAVGRCFDLRRRSISSTRHLADRAAFQAHCSGAGNRSVPILESEFPSRDNLKLHLSLAEILSLRVKYLFREAMRPQSVVPAFYLLNRTIHPALRATDDRAVNSIVVDLALPFAQDRPKKRMEGITRRTSCHHLTTLVVA
jgi:hypothetical protein